MKRANSMKRSGFTMIELIFVIVILGILSAVALPKFIGVSEQAEAGKCKAFIGTMNRTVGPAIWSDMVLNNKLHTEAFVASALTSQVEVPPLCGVTATELVNMANGTGAAKTGIAIGDGLFDINSSVATVSVAPVWEWKKTN